MARAAPGGNPTAGGAVLCCNGPCALGLPDSLLHAAAT